MIVGLIHLGFISAIVYFIVSIVISERTIGRKFRIINCGNCYRIERKVLLLWFHKYGDSLYTSYDNVEDAEKDLNKYIKNETKYRENKGQVVKVFELRPPKKQKELELMDVNYDPLEKIKQNY